MEKDTITLTWSMVPDGWALCYNDACPLHRQCLRCQAAQLAPEELTVTRCITPQALKDGQCPHFASAEPVRMAKGFSTIYEDVLKKDYTPLRTSMTAMLSGKRIYYEYMRGERGLTPEQQDAIRALFTEYGYADSVHFDAYEYAYQFPWV